MTNMSVGFPVGPVRPYFSGGIGLVRTNVEFTSSDLLSSDNSSFGYNLGGGVNFMFPHHLGVRLDYRRFTSTNITALGWLGMSPGQNLSFSRFSIGLVLH
jgi:opacity protein-like surface antigen